MYPTRFTFVFLLVLLQGCASKKPVIDFSSIQFAERPKNIIFLIGDGMGLSQMSAHIYWKGVNKTIFEKMPIVGFHKSHSCDDLVTDSAAGATAFSCGKKTTNGAIGVLPDSLPCTTILEDLDHKGYATGMVVACTATHATPASFIAHRELRAFTDEIALDFLKTPMDCFIGGGGALFYDRADKLNLVDSLKQKGYMVRKGTNLSKLPWDGEFPFFLFTHDREPPTASGGREYMPKATALVASYLKKRSDKGFFMMVEGSQIDWACHANDRNWLRNEMEDFDKTVMAAMEFAAADKETLVVVTGDHECGGLSLNQGDTKKSFKPYFANRRHSAALVPVYAYGPGAALFQGIYDNTLIYGKMREALSTVNSEQ
jgi:alkaline phosphatase